MTEQLNTILTGKPIIIKDNQYLSTEAYVSPFVERLSAFTHDFKCQVKMPDQLSITEGNPDNIYTRVNIQAIIPTDASLSYDRVVGMAYGLDTKKPSVKFYIGIQDREHENFVAFDPTNCVEQEIEPSKPFDYTVITPLMAKTDYVNTMLSQMMNRKLNISIVKSSIGSYLDYILDGFEYNLSGKVKLSAASIIETYKRLFKDQDSEFFVKNAEEITLWEVYMAMLGVIRDDDKDVINKFEKTMLINKMLQL